MSAGQWLLLTDYASKYRISVSTLRRRIKAGQVEHRFDNGKYYLLDQAQQGFLSDEHVSAPSMSPHPVQAAPLSANSSTYAAQAEHAAETADEPIISSATKLLNELKRAYMNILQEKEEQIIQLKEEVSDLKTLVRVLEDDNERLRRYTGSTFQPRA